QNDPSAEWMAYAIQSADGNYYAHGTPPSSNYCVVSKGFKYPEVVMKMINVSQECGLMNYDWYNEVRGTGGKYAAAATQLLPVEIGAKYSNEISTRWKVVKDALDGVTNPEDIDSVAKNIYDQIKINQANPKKQLDAWMNDVAWTRGAAVFLDNPIQQNV
ncbi:MAG TPA: hypothetical protein PKE04_17180, partial [Clostridia bacterium]|nr:hypothetical protein [Clostridia bacterium]